MRTVTIFVEELVGRAGGEELGDALVQLQAALAPGHSQGRLAVLVGVVGVVLLASSAVGTFESRQEAQGLVVDLDQGLGLLQVAQDGFDQLRIEAAAGRAAARSSSGALPSRNNQRASRGRYRGPAAAAAVLRGTGRYWGAHLAAAAASIARGAGRG